MNHRGAGPPYNRAGKHGSPHSYASSSQTWILYHLAVFFNLSQPVAAGTMKANHSGKRAYAFVHKNRI